MNKNPGHILLITVLVFLSAGAAFGLRAWLHPPLHLQAAELLPEPNKNLQGYGYQLRDIDDHPIPLELAIDHWILLLFGCTVCPDYPLKLQELEAMLKQFGGVDSQYKPVVIFVSLDPEQDSPQRLGTLAKNFRADMKIATAHNDELTNIANFFGVSYNSTTMTIDKVPLVNYSSRIFIIDPKLRYIGYFAAPYHADTLYSDMQQLIHQSWRYHIQR